MDLHLVQPLFCIFYFALYPSYILQILYCDYIQKDCSNLTVPIQKKYILHFLFCDRIQKDCSPLSAACINDLPAWAKSLVSLPHPLQLFTIFCLLLYLENLYLLSLHLFSFLHFVKLIICISFFWPLALMICLPERNPLYPSLALSSPLYPFYLFLNSELLHF